MLTPESRFRLLLVNYNKKADSDARNRLFLLNQSYKLQ